MTLFQRDRENIGLAGKRGFSKARIRLQKF